MSSVLMRLNVATRRWHALVDDPWLRLLQPGMRRVDYRAELVRMYGFQAPLDGACAYTPRLVQRPRAGLIAQDLMSLGMSPIEISRLAQCPQITMFDEPLEALGWLYVVERMALLHERIARPLASALELGRATAYISAHGGQVGTGWHRFGLLLARLAPEREQANRVIAAAHTGFECLSHWPGYFARSRCAV